MTRTEILASSRPQAAASTRNGGSGASRRFAGLVVVSLLAVALGAPTTALAASSGESGYSQTPTTPKTTSTTTTTSKPAEPKSGTAPSKEVSPSKAATTATTPTSTTKPTTETAKTLPFTGLDLRWIVAAGILMMGAGFSIVTVQRRQRRR